MQTSKGNTPELASCLGGERIRLPERGNGCLWRALLVSRSPPHLQKPGAGGHPASSWEWEGEQGNLQSTHGREGEEEAVGRETA